MVHNDVFIEKGANEINDNIIYDFEVHNNDVIIEDSENECHDVIDNMAINHFNRNFSERSSASENENIKQIDITCEGETFQNEQNVADNIYDTEYE